MCHFIFVGVPKEVDEIILDDLAKSHRIRLKPGWMTISGHGLDAEIFYGTAGHCDCGTSIGSRLRETAPENKLERKVKAWRRKKWSEEKIARAVASMTDETLHKRADDGDDTEQWVEFLSALLRRSGGPHVSLVLHWTRNEREFDVTGVQKIQLGQASHKDLLDWEEDVLYVCTA